MNENLKEQERGWTENNLKSALIETRDQNAGIPITRVAEIIKEIFDKSEIKYLIKEMK